MPQQRDSRGRDEKEKQERNSLSGLVLTFDISCFRQGPHAHTCKHTQNTCTHTDDAECVGVFLAAVESDLY